MLTVLLLFAILPGTAERNAAGEIVALDLHGEWVTDSDLHQLASMPKLERIDLSLTRITDHGMKLMRDLKGVRELNLYFAENVTDEGIAALKGWKNLRRLNLRGTKITDTTLEHLAGLSSLESLDVGFAQVTDNGLEKLGALENLKELTIGGNKLTDVGLEALRQLQSLQYLDLSGQQRTDSGLWFASISERGADTLLAMKNLRVLRVDGLRVPQKLQDAKIVLK